MTDMQRQPYREGDFDLTPLREALSGALGDTPFTASVSLADYGNRAVFHVSIGDGGWLYSAGPVHAERPTPAAAVRSATTYFLKRAAERLKVDEPAPVQP